METHLRGLMLIPDDHVPPSGGSLEIGNGATTTTLIPGVTGSSPFGGIPRNWKLPFFKESFVLERNVPPSGGSLEIGNVKGGFKYALGLKQVPPSGGSLEIGNI